MARPIDGDALKRWCEKIIDQACHPATVQIGEVFLDKVRSMPTLTPPNEALTLEELREMDGVNALWVHNLAWGLHKPRFMLVHSVSEDWWTCCDFDGFETFCADDYGERYLLYRRPPEVSP